MKTLGAILEARRGRADWSFIYDDTLDKTVRVKYLGQGYEKTAFLNEDEDTVYVITESEFYVYNIIINMVKYIHSFSCMCIPLPI